MSRAVDPIERFWRQVDKTPTCWLWTGGLTGAGYGGFGAERIAETKRNRFVLAHRFAYELIIGPIPDGLQLDHLCRVPRCVRPSHLEAVTPRTNTLRGIGPTAVAARRTHCVNGHDFTAENTWHYGGARHCRECRRASFRDWEKRNRERRNAYNRDRKRRARGAA